VPGLPSGETGDGDAVARSGDQPQRLYAFVERGVDERVVAPSTAVFLLRIHDALGPLRARGHRLAAIRRAIPASA
jgi:hypothetical protein